MLSRKRENHKMRARAQGYVAENPRTSGLAIAGAVLVLAGIGVGIFFLVRFLGKKDDATPTPKHTAKADGSVPPPVPPPVPLPAPRRSEPPLTMTPVGPDVPMPVDVAVPPKPEVVDVAVLVGVLPDAIDVTIESDEPDLRGLSGTYYYSFSVGFGWDPRIRSWAWTLDSVAAPGGSVPRGKTRAQLEYSNEDGKWDLSLNSGDPYPEPPGLLRATTGPLDKWNSVWGAKWTRVEPIGTMSERQRQLVMPLIKVKARGTGVIAPWT